MTPPAPHILDNIQYANCFFWGCILGLCGWIFGRPIEKKKAVSKPKPTPPKKVKGAKRKAKQAKQPKRKKQKAETKTWATLPDYTDYQIANIERMFRVGRGETVNEN